MSETIKSPSSHRSPSVARDIAKSVAAIISDIRDRGDSAVREFSEKFDEWSPTSFLLSPTQVERIVASVPEATLSDISWAQDQVRKFARHQRNTMTDLEVETLPGVVLGHRHIPVQAVGAYVPGGRYPLVASAQMTIVTAKEAGVPRVAACTPPINGEVPAASVAAMHMAGADEIYVLGGVQAIAAMALGTQTVQGVHLVAGPGNAYVAEAKRQLFGDVGIDLLAGPTEILIVADETADPTTVAVDLLSQAEHGPDSPAVLITTSPSLGRQVLETIHALLPGMPTRELAGPAWRDHGEIHVVPDLDQAYAMADSYASEHVEILTAAPREALDRMTHYGAIFLGSRTCVPFGDKVIGTNHVLPTRGGARHSGGLWVGSYLRTVTFQEVRDDRASADLGRRCARASRLEHAEGHARAGDLRAAVEGPIPEWLLDLRSSHRTDQPLPDHDEHASEPSASREDA